MICLKIEFRVRYDSGDITHTCRAVACGKPATCLMDVSLEEGTCFCVSVCKEHEAVLDRLDKLDSRKVLGGIGMTKEEYEKEAGGKF